MDDFKDLSFSQSAKETTIDFWLIISIWLFSYNCSVLNFTTQPHCLGHSFSPFPSI